MKRYIKSYADTRPEYNNYKVVSLDDTYEENARYFVTYGEALQYGNQTYGSRYDIEEI